jgi:RNA polymerase sigma-70 factor (ECF subfamily)
MRLTMPATPCCSQGLLHFVPRVDLVETASSSGSGDQPPGPGRGDDQPRGREVEAGQLVDLMSQCARGHEDAFAQLYDLTSNRIYSIILRVLRSPDHAAEVTQEVYVEIWRQSARYASDKGSVIAWMTTMAHRRAVDRVRSVSSEAARDERYAFTGTERETDIVWDSVEQKLDVERVRRGMASLTAIQREALTLAYFGGYTQSQVAQLLKLPLGTVKTRIRDGLIGLRDALGVET